MLKQLDKKSIEHLLEELNEALKKKKITGEIYLVGGAVMCLAFDARESTIDIDALFRPKEEIARAAKIIGDKYELTAGWLNDGVKGFLSSSGEFTPYKDLSNLKILHASPEYLLAMKCMSMRLGAEFSDERDVIFLLRYLNIDNAKKALDVISKFYPKNKFPQKTLYALQEILD